MSLTKSNGNMYPWVTHTHNYLAGECPHQCSYCYVQAMADRFPAMGKKYHGQIRLIEAELFVPYGEGKIIFIEHMNDLFADAIPADYVHQVMGHCRAWPKNTYVFQSKNPGRMKGFLEAYHDINAIAGTTIETNRPTTSKAPSTEERYMEMELIRCKKFVTIEPIMDFDVEILSYWINRIRPSFVNIGADSKGRGLTEPSACKIKKLIDLIQRAGIEIREKHNLGRLLS